MQHSNENRPWLSAYSEGIPYDLPMPEITGIEQFRRTAARLPQTPAVYYFDAILSFEQIEFLSNSLSAAFVDFGVCKGDRISLYMQNIPQYWIANLAAWKAGAIIVPLNAMLKAKELVYHLNDSGATVIVCMESLYDKNLKSILGETSVRHVITTCELDLLNQPNRPSLLQSVEKMNSLGTVDLMDLCRRFQGAADPRVEVDPDDVSMLVFTSGTTGNPKGAMISHSNVAYNAEVYRKWADLDEKDVILGGAPLFHITGLIAHMATSALTGAPMILSYRFDAEEILRLVDKWKATFTVMAITAYMALYNHPDIDKRDIRSLRKGYSGGAPIPEAMVQAFQQKTGVYIHAVYGLTETTSPSHMVPCGFGSPLNSEYGVLSVGLPVSGCLCKVVDLKTREDVESGKAGEIVIKGPMVTSGYWENAEATAKSIVDGWFYTGDVGIMDEQGWFYVIDRTKDMIIASGFKVWPREVEDVLYLHPAVREAGVIGIPDEYRGETVKGFVSLRAGCDATPEELIAFCKERMADYKYPRQIQILDEIPKTASGKFLRRELKVFN